MTDPFDFVEIFGIKIHLWTVIVIVVAVLIPLYLLRKIDIIHRLLIILTLGVFSKSVLESAYLVGLGIFPILDLLFVVGIFPVIFLLNRKFCFLQLNKGFILLSIVQASVLLLMWYTGFFQALDKWMCQHGPDPHNWMWLITRGLGFWLWFSLIKINKEE